MRLLKRLNNFNNFYKNKNTKIKMGKIVYFKFIKESLNIFKLKNIRS